ncbi:MAG: hypothetical protein OXE40_17820, partial [Gammaproteobacteria bacterium]|nr:hypothetical protein [Gammaproteobacteria bacterium]
MRVLLAKPLLLIATVLAGCQSVPPADTAGADRPTAATAASLRPAVLDGGGRSDPLPPPGAPAPHAKRLG